MRRTEPRQLPHARCSQGNVLGASHEHACHAWPKSGCLIPQGTGPAASSGSCCLSFHAPTRHTGASQVCPRERIGVPVQQQNAEVFHSRHSCFENPFAPKAPRVLTPETVSTERISGTDPDEFMLLLGPDFGHVSVAFTLSHGPPHHGSSHDEASINHERQRCIWTRGRDQMYASKAEQQPPQYL